MSKLLGKNALSPLIATILLIAFAVALGSVLVNLGTNIDLARDKCKSVEIKLRNIGNSEVCYKNEGTNGYVNFILDNNGKKIINGLSIIIRGDKTSSIYDLNDINIPEKSLFDKKDQEVAYDNSRIGIVKEVEFQPKIKVENQLETCSKKSVISEKVGPCQ